MQRERRKNNDILFHFRKDGLPMTKLSQLKIDPEFQNQINPPSFEETHQLEMNILKEERVLNPIITWNGYIVDSRKHRGLSRQRWSALLRKMSHPKRSVLFKRHRSDGQEQAPRRMQLPAH